ncbi:MAG TPA: NAD(P)/FAD-dependent oxidoreductase [Opitutus sp.]|nr:NAD(P)/FAD-dependent oxidoreductase [Opitutus sp.]
MSRRHVVVIGAGPAGLSAAHELVRAGHRVTVLERDPEYVGGIARTVRYKQWRFDLGGHRFFSKNPAIVAWWRERLGAEFIAVRRMSRILYRGRFFDYPLRAGNALRGLGLLESAGCVASYLWAKLTPVRPERSFADWVRNRFGARLYRIFFKSYTEKVWGIPCEKISADWAAQRIKNLSLVVAVLSAFGWKRGGEVKTLIDTFEYPRLGPGMMWERVRDEVVAGGGEVRLGAEVETLAVSDGRVRAVTFRTADGGVHEIACDEVIASSPLSDTVRALGDAMPESARRAAERLHYRDFALVALVVRGERLFADNWLYVHDPNVRVGRIQNFNNWSAALNEAPGTTCLGFEYFCAKGDALWSMDDDALIRLAATEMERLGLAQTDSLIDGAVVRVEKTYPVYDEHYRTAVDEIRSALVRIPNLQPVGRNGMHKYNNQDHSMLTGMMAARRLDGGRHDPWRVNSDAEYLEEAVAESAEEARVRSRTERAESL